MEGKYFKTKYIEVLDTCVLRVLAHPFSPLRCANKYRFGLARNQIDISVVGIYYNKAEGSTVFVSEF